MGTLIASVVIGYLLGSLPIAVLLTRIRGVDILEVGTRNPGAANVFRTVSRRLGVLVFLGDGLKGILAVALAGFLGLPAELAAVAGAAAVLGHWYPLFLRFKGGAGLATAAGAGIALSPLAGLIGVAVAGGGLVYVRNTAYSAALAYAVYVPISVYSMGWEVTVGATLLGVLVLVRALVVQELQKRRRAG